MGPAIGGSCCGDMPQQARTERPGRVQAPSRSGSGAGASSTGGAEHLRPIGDSAAALARLVGNGPRVWSVVPQHPTWGDA